MSAGRRWPSHFWWSMFRVFSAFGLAVVTAVPIGIAMGVNRYVRGIFDPPIEFYRPLPPLSYLPLVVIWFGIDEASKVILIYLACFAPLALSARAGVRSRLASSRSMRPTRWARRAARWSATSWCRRRCRRS